MQNEYGYDRNVGGAPGRALLVAARIGSFLLMASGVLALLFARLFSNLSALSSGFVERSRVAFAAGAACFAIGLIIKMLIASRMSRERADPRWITEATTVEEFTIESLSVRPTGTSFEDALNARLRAAARRSDETLGSPQWLASDDVQRQSISKDYEQEPASARFHPSLQAGSAGEERRRSNVKFRRRREARPDPMAVWRSPRFGAVERVVLAVLVAVVAGWFGFAIVTFFVQDSLVFSPRSITDARLERIATDYPHAEEITIPIDGNVLLHGWLLPPAEHSSVSRWGSAPESPSNSSEGSPEGSSPTSLPNTHLGSALGTPPSALPASTTSTFPPDSVADGASVPLMLVFAGQGGEASGYFELAERLPELAWAFINYRGYGLSDGVPSDKALFHDAVAVYDHFAARADIDGNNIFALGGSLGTGVATYLAAQRPVAGVVLFSPYDRIGGGVAQDLMPWLPTKLMFKNRFDAGAYAPEVHAPALAIVGDSDAVIRPERSRALMRAWGQPHRLMVVADGDHYSVYENDSAWRAVDGFVRGLLQ